eukprot:TRINITY_DN5546_c0_g1_i1.p1 TRINITY_DN5546_c0_g1~~TRINITY_DN5546_c0_g1_i1.p1  ORF type:complete len:759 (+),score=98.19 TRINITY_DN5546_c0_g1_i1:398-2674(+)
MEASSADGTPTTARHAGIGGPTFDPTVDTPRIQRQRPRLSTSSDLDTTSFPTDSSDSDATFLDDDEMPFPHYPPLKHEPPSPETIARSDAIAALLGEARVVFCQACIRRWMQRKRFRNRVRMHKRRNTIMQELLESETAYVDSLDTIVEVYLQPLRENLEISAVIGSPSSAGSILPSQNTLRSLFSDIDVIRNYNTHLLHSLRQRYAKWTPSTRIGDIFLTMNHFLKPYSTYCTDYKKALGTLGKLNRSQSFVLFLERALQRPESKGRSLRDLLQLPVQRIPQYKAMLDELALNTWASHRDKGDLIKAAQSITELANYVIDSKTDVQHIIQVLNIQGRLTGKFENLVNTSRRFIREGDLIEVRGKSKRATYHMFLFSDVLLFTKPDENVAEYDELHYCVKRTFALEELTSAKETTISSTISADQVAVDAHGAGYALSLKTETKTILLIAPSARERKQWLADLYACIDDAIVQHYFRLVEAQKRVVHQELIAVVSSRKWSKAHNGNASRSISPEKDGSKKKRAITIGRIMGRKVAADVNPPATQTTQNPLHSSLNRSSTASLTNDPVTRRSSVGGTLPVLSDQPLGIRYENHDLLSRHPLEGDPKVLQKSVSTTQLDLLIAEMKHDPRRAIFLAPKLEHTMKRIQQEAQLFDQQQKRPKKKTHKFTRSISWTFKGAEEEKEKVPKKRNTKGSSHDSKLKTHSRVSSRSEKEKEREDRDTDRRYDEDKDKGKERDKGPPEQPARKRNHASRASEDRSRTK